MEKGFRTIQCGGCPTKLKFPVTPKDYNKTLQVRCPRCRTVCRVLVPTPADFRPAVVKPTVDDPFIRDLDSWTEALYGDLFGGKRGGVRPS